VKIFTVRCLHCKSIYVETRKDLDTLKTALSYQTTCPNGHVCDPSRLELAEIRSTNGHILHSPP
jgi:hypothetical protein